MNTGYKIRKMKQAGIALNKSDEDAYLDYAEKMDDCIGAIKFAMEDLNNNIGMLYITDYDDIDYGTAQVLKGCAEALISQIDDLESVVKNPVKNPNPDY